MLYEVITHHHHGHGHHHHDHHQGSSEEHQSAHANLHNNPQLNDPKTISVITKILDKNDHEAAHNRAHFDEYGVSYNFV